MKFPIRIHPDAIKYLNTLDTNVKMRILKGIVVLETEPWHARSGADIKILRGTKGRQNLYRLRVGDYRIVYSIEDNCVWITEIFHRGKGYDI